MICKTSAYSCKSKYAPMFLFLVVEGGKKQMYMLEYVGFDKIIINQED